MEQVTVPASRIAAATAAATVLAGCLFLGCSGPTTVRAASVKPDKERKDAPEFSLKDANGKLVHLADYKGKVVLLDFWATWCGPCVVEIPWFTEIQRKYKDRGFEVVGVSMDDEGWKSINPFVRETLRKSTTALCSAMTPRAIKSMAASEALPTTFVIDRYGRENRRRPVGLTNKKDLEDGN